ncbi:hypothetical protein [Campylobacter molothri]|uniref:hypothetical protein n=1 Tax=Campylobacter molothri TaxID=1032242 RepID=UPI001E15581E|nr:hypothetical protein [Campylobacter sp. W0045]
MDNFKSFLYLYGKFLQCDLLCSLDEDPDNPKNVDIIIFFRDTLAAIYALDFNDNSNELSLLFSSLDQTIKSYIEKSEYNTVDLKLCEIKNNSKVFEALDSKDFKQIFQEFIVSCEAFKQIKKIKNSKIEKFLTDKEGNKVLVQSLLEFSNAMAHILITSYSIEDKHCNIEKAKNHLYRGILDNYKMLLRFCDKRLNNNNSLTLLIKTIRENEFFHLGQNITSKTIKYDGEKIDMAKAYKELYEIFFGIKKSAFKLDTNYIG